MKERQRLFRTLKQFCRLPLPQVSIQQDIVTGVFVTLRLAFNHKMVDLAFVHFKNSSPATEFETVCCVDGLHRLNLGGYEYRRCR